MVNEAMASGLPVVSTRIGGIPEMLREGETAFLVEPGDVTALRECLFMLTQNPELRAKMGAAGHEFLVQAGAAGTPRHKTLMKSLPESPKRQGDADHWPCARHHRCQAIDFVVYIVLDNFMWIRATRPPCLSCLSSIENGAKPSFE